jgi:hypothetical protein
MRIFVLLPNNQVMKKYLLILLAICGIHHAFAQSNAHYTEKEYARHPVWLQMMQDPKVNYFEIEKAYKIYWEHHAKPTGEQDVIGEHEAREKNPSKRELKKIEADNNLRIAVKKYEHWRMKMQPYVQADGRILTTEERLKIWEEQKKNTNK